MGRGQGFDNGRAARTWPHLHLPSLRMRAEQRPLGPFANRSLRLIRCSGGRPERAVAESSQSVIDVAERFDVVDVDADRWVRTHGVVIPDSTLPQSTARNLQDDGLDERAEPVVAAVGRADPPQVVDEPVDRVGGELDAQVRRGRPAAATAASGDRSSSRKRAASRLGNSLT